MRNHSRVHMAFRRRLSGAAAIDGNEGIFDIAVEALYAINRSRSGAGVSSAREIKTATLAVKPEAFTLLKAACEDIRLAVRANELLVIEEPQLVEGTGIEVRQIEFVTDGSKRADELTSGN